MAAEAGGDVDYLCGGGEEGEERGCEESGTEDVGGHVGVEGGRGEGEGGLGRGVEDCGVVEEDVDCEREGGRGGVESEVGEGEGVDCEREVRMEGRAAMEAAEEVSHSRTWMVAGEVDWRVRRAVRSPVLRLRTRAKVVLVGVRERCLTCSRPRPVRAPVMTMVDILGVATWLFNGVFVDRRGCMGLIEKL